MINKLYYRPYFNKLQKLITNNFLMKKYSVQTSKIYVLVIFYIIILRLMAFTFNIDKI